VITIDSRAKGSITVICETDNRVIKYFRCRHVICAAPLAVSRTINFPNISTAKKLIIDNQLRTNSVKSFMVVKSPFWRRDSSGKPLANGDCLFSGKYIVNMCHDISPLDESCGIIVFFHNGRKLDAWESTYTENDNAKKKEYFINLMSKMFKVKSEDRAKLF
jgi:monoamine oxidase